MDNLEKIYKAKKNTLTLYLTINYPSKSKFYEIVDTLVESGMDILEIGIPVKNPVMDGETIRQTHEKVLKEGLTKEDITQCLTKIRDKYPSLPIVIMSYWEGIEKYSLLELTNYYDALICPDKFLQLETKNIDVVQIYHEEMALDEIKENLKYNNGFAYVLSSKGKTGAKKELSNNYKKTIEKINSLSNIPTQIGFGVYKKEHVESILNSGANGVIIGSEITRKINENLDNLKTYVENLKEPFNS